MVARLWCLIASFCTGILSVYDTCNFMSYFVFFGYNIYSVHIYLTQKLFCTNITQTFFFFLILSLMVKISYTFSYLYLSFNIKYITIRVTNSVYILTVLSMREFMCVCMDVCRISCTRNLNLSHPINHISVYTCFVMGMILPYIWSSSSNSSE